MSWTRKKCNFDGCNNPVFSQGFCQNHMLKKKLKSSNTKLKSNYKQKTDEERKSRLKMLNMFLSVWNKRPHRSEISNAWLGKEAASWMFHHILPKRDYPELKYNEDNIVLLTLIEHDDVEMNPNKFPHINKIREELITKYITNEKI